MLKPSNALLELKNLFGLVSHHLQQGCGDSDCRISCFVAKQTAERLMRHVDAHERHQAQDIVKRWPF